MINSKFKVGDLVRGSSCLTKGACTEWTDYRNSPHPTKYKSFGESIHHKLKNEDIGIVVKVARSWLSQIEYEVKFIQTGITIIVPDRCLKWAK